MPTKKTKVQKQVEKIMSRMESGAILDYLIQHRDKIEGLVVLVDFTDDRRGKLYTSFDEPITVLALETSKMAVINEYQQSKEDDEDEEEE